MWKSLSCASTKGRPMTASSETHRTARAGISSENARHRRSHAFFGRDDAARAGQPGYTQRPARHHAAGDHLASPPMVIAIDGPAGAGKSTVARAVAERLGFTYLDTGAMYRAVALAAAGREGEAAAIAERADIRVGDRVLLDGRDVTDEIRTPEASAGASRVAADPGVRAALVRMQQAIVADGDWVAEGRDIGSVVVPDAAVKVFLTASAEERARRRAAQTGASPADV